MFQVQRRRGMLQTAFNMAELIFHWAVRGLITGHQHPVISLFKGLMQSLVMIGVLFVMFSFLGMRSSAVRGDFVMYLISGVACFMIQNRAISAVAGTPGHDAAIMQHLPMNPTIVFLSSALQSLFQAVLLIVVLLGGYEAATGNVEINDPVRALGIFVAVWFVGICIGAGFLGLSRHFPTIAKIGQTAFRRANMIFSGKMFLANSMPGYMLVMFSWNPLFHLIDQMRGAIFVNYNPHFTNLAYPLKVGLTLLVVGLILEFGARGTATVLRGADY